jgi:hypothetical protein
VEIFVTDASKQAALDAYWAAQTPAEERAAVDRMKLLGIWKAASSTNLELLRAVGEVAFGEFWQSPMAEALVVNRRTINRWKQKLWEVPDALPDGRPLMPELQRILAKHERDLASVKKRIEKERS